MFTSAGGLLRMLAPQEGGSEDKGTTASVQKSGSRTPKRECTEGGDDQESRIVG